ncbi:MAG: MdtA/MuxA family multidrug efflux RND transporter periplasmic adaptor subunit [Alcaligenaceae bacterium]|nr:MdtA/MuxA family multidrug efflux RND transporter periplasmic adaptor subunit [Alcaligenaceae bacterium]
MSEALPGQSAVAPRRRRGVWILLVLVLGAAGYWWYDSKQAATPAGASSTGRPPAMAAMMANMAVPVRVQPAETAEISQILRAVGTVTASSTVTVRSRVDGLLDAVLFENGQAVNEGDVLARIDPRPFQARLDQVQGQLKQSQAQLKNARQDLQRFQTLFRQNSLARQQLDTQAALVMQLEGQVQADQAQVDDAALQLGFTQVTAPVSGRLGLSRLDAGNMINASDANGLVVITRTRPIEVNFSVPQASLPDILPRFRAGETLVVELYDRTDTHLLTTGKLTALDNQIDLTTGTVTLKAQFDNDDESLFPNQFVNVRLRITTESALTIPAVAVQQGSMGAFVYRVNTDNIVSLQTIKTGWIDGARVVVESGLEPGDRVVTEGVDRLRNGSKVEIVTGERAAPRRPGGASP